MSHLKCLCGRLLPANPKSRMCRDCRDHLADARARLEASGTPEPPPRPPRLRAVPNQGAEQ